MKKDKIHSFGETYVRATKNSNPLLAKNQNWVGTLLAFSLLFLGSIGIGQAQYFERGDLMLGSDLGSGLVNTASDGLFGLNIGLNDGSGFNLGISPKVGYFLNENFMVGATVNLGFSESPESEGESVSSFVYGFQGLTRFYIAPADVEAEELPGQSRFFFENNAGVAGVNIKDGPSTFGFAFGFGPGLAYFITNNVALEATVKYNGLLGDDTIDYQNSIGINLGVQIFLSGSNSIEGVIEGQ
jgi:opacity protein-like surface antigen